MRDIMIFVLGLLAGSALTQWVKAGDDGRMEDALEQFVARMDSCRQAADAAAMERQAAPAKKAPPTARKNGDGRTYSATSGEVVTRKPLQVQKVLENGDAVAQEYNTELALLPALKCSCRGGMEWSIMTNRLSRFRPASAPDRLACIETATRHIR